MKKVGVLTWKLHNYGTALQAYALNRYLKDKGIDCYLVNYSLEYKNLSRVNKFTIRTIICKLNNRFLNKLEKIRLQKYNKMHINDIKLSEVRFNAFYDSIPHIGSKIIEKNFLWDAVKECYAVICGSDQIWSPKYLDTSYYLDFVPDNIRKIAYAPSIAIKNYTISEVKLIKPLLERFDNISIREEDGRLLLNSMGFKDVFLVADPTLLLSKEIWNKDFKEYKGIQSNDYILIYLLSDNKWYQNTIDSILKDFSNCSIIIIPKTVGAYRFRGGGLRCDAGPIEFVHLIKNAKYVITDSYHGMCLAIKFEINFTILQRFDEKKSGAENSRVESLLCILSLENRLIKWKQNNFHMFPIDWNIVSKKLLPLIYTSEIYLKKALEDKVRI